MKRFLGLSGAAAFAFASLAACSNDPTVTQSQDATGANITFHQIDREGKPGIKVLYLAYGQHDGYNRNTPQNDAAAYAPSIASFVTGTAGRSAGIATYVEDLLMPDALIANTNVTGNASYLGWETNGQIASSCIGGAPSEFGGRGLYDDVVSTDLGLAFGDLATSATLKSPTPNVVNLTGTGTATPIPPNDGREKTALSAQHVSCANKGFTNATFPYLAAPI